MRLSQDAKFPKTKMKLSKTGILFTIIAIAFILRFLKLDSIPIGFNDDEAAFGYNAYSILKTGRDEWGRTLPFPVFESFGDWKLVGYLYPTVASEAIFGKNVFAVRFPSAVIGVLAVIATYLLAKKMFDGKIALLSAFLLAISPWHIIASRNAFESDTLIFFITLAVYFFLKGLKAKNYLFFSFLSFTISLYIYRSAWIFVPLFALTIIFLYTKELYRLRIYFLKIFLTCVILLIPLMPSALSFSGQSRFFQESFIYGVSKSGIINEINEKRGSCFEHSPQVFCKIAYNKYLSYITIFFNNYFENLSPQTYFTKAPPRGYQSFTDRGLFYSFELPLFVAGIVMLIIRRESALKILIPWILIAPIGASFTGVGNPGRLNILMPSLQIVEACGFFALLEFSKAKIFKKVLISLAIALLAVSVSRLWADMFYRSPKISAAYQRYGYQQLFDYLNSQKVNYEKIAISRKNDDAKQYIHYLFFENIPPENFFDSSFTTYYRGQDNWQVVEKIGNLYFYPSAPSLRTLPQSTLLVTEEHEASFPQKPIFVVDYPNSDRAFEVYDVDKLQQNLKLLNEL